MRLRIGVLVLASIGIASGIFLACSTFGEGATPSDEAGAVVSEAGVDSSIPACPDGAALCDHFERGTSPDMLTGPWDPTLYGDSRVVLYLDSSQQKTGAMSLRARDQGTGGQGALTFRVKDDIAITIELDLRISRVQPLSTIIVQYALNDGSIAVNISLDKDGIKLSEQSLSTDPDSGYADIPSIALTPEVWTHVIFTLGDDHIARLALPEQSLTSQKKISHALDSGSQVRLGLPYVMTHAEDASFDVWFDDVYITH